MTAYRACSLVVTAAVCLSACQPQVSKTPSPSAAKPQQTWPVVAKRLELESGLTSSDAAPSPLLEMLEQELQRSMGTLAQQTPPVYHLTYQVTDKHEHVIAASDGGLLQSHSGQDRMLDVDVRVGGYQLDQTRSLPGEFERGGFKGVELLPLDGSGITPSSLPVATKNGIWLATNRAYEAARERFLLVSQNSERAQGREERDAVASFTKTEPVRRIEPVLNLELNVNQWEQVVRDVSRLSTRFPRVMSSGVTLESNVETRYLVNSDGSETQTSQRRVRLSLTAGATAKDGLPVGQFDSFEATTVDGLPNQALLRQRFERVLGDVERLLDAPLIDPYVGPAILDGKAAGVFFHEVFGHRIEGHRQDADNEGQTFSSRVGEVIMPEFLSVYDDPQLVKLNGVELSGHYSVDDEGVVGQRATLVEHGVLRDFLMSREPTRAVTRSNGHGRRSPGNQIVARQANLVVDPSTVVSRDTLKQALLSEVRRQGLPFGLRFSEISGGYTQTARYDTQAFKVMPVMVYRVYLDGKEELVRGVDIEGTPLTALSKISLAADDFQVFNGVCGAESGWVPVSATSPSLLVSQIEVARQELSEARPPVLPSPKLDAPTAEASHSDALSGGAP